MECDDLKEIVSGPSTIHQPIEKLLQDDPDAKDALHHHCFHYVLKIALSSEKTHFPNTCPTIARSISKPAEAHMLYDPSNAS